MAAAALAAFAIVFGALLLVDPYGSARTGLFRGRGVPDQYPTTANASRTRDPRFDAAILGNSRVQQLSPERLDKLTGAAFVSMIMPGSVPADQLALLRWYLAWDRPPPRAIVLGMDAPWCLPEMAFSARFPAWLYETSLLPYAAGLVRWRAIEAASNRLSYIRTGKGGARPDGYWDYRPVFAQLGLADPEASRRKIERIDSSTFGPNPNNRFPALDELAGLMRMASPDTRFALLRPPVHANGLPKPGTPEARAAEVCAGRVAALAAGRPGTAVIDLLKPGPIAADATNFYDYDHYRDPIAQRIEALIAASLDTRR